MGGEVGGERVAREDVEHEKSDAQSSGRFFVHVNGVQGGVLCEGRGVGGGEGGVGEGVGDECWMLKRRACDRADVVGVVCMRKSMGGMSVES